MAPEATVGGGLHLLECLVEGGREEERGPFLNGRNIREPVFSPIGLQLCGEVLPCEEGGEGGGCREGEGSVVHHFRVSGGVYKVGQIDDPDLGRPVQFITHLKGTD